MSLKSSNKVETNVWEIEASIDGAVFMDAVNKTYLKKRKDITLPGFRRGKAPRAFIEKYYGESVFYEDALELVYPDAVSSAIEEAGLDAVASPHDLEVPEMGKDGVLLKFKVTVKPEVELGEYKGIKATRAAVSVSASEVEAELDRMREQNATVTEIEDRAAEKGDLVEIDYEGFTDGKPFKGGKAEGCELTLGSGRFIPGFEEQVVGHRTGEKFDVKIPLPKNYPEDLAGRDAVFKVRLRKIKLKELPDPDDEFARDVSEFDTFDELKKNVKAGLKSRKRAEADEEAKSAVMDAVAKGIKAEIPAVMFENEIDGEVDDFFDQLRSRGIKPERYFKYAETDMPSLRESCRPRAERQVRLRLALEKVAELEKLEPSEEELAAEYERYAKTYNMKASDVREVVSESSAKAQLTAKKALDFILENAEITDEKPAAKKTASAGKPKEKSPAAAKRSAAKKAEAKAGEPAE